MKRIIVGQSTYDGAGVKLNRIFAHSLENDPFLLLDHFGSDDPKDYIKGFPWHPHRGIETVTYMLKGEVEHGDSIGNKGVIGPGDIQWMSAGSGIIHQEMPQGTHGMTGLQLWVNMPAKRKMSDPKYRGIVKEEIPTVKEGGVDVKVISGSYGGKTGSVRDLLVDVLYFDITMDKDKIFKYNVNKNYTTFFYILEGSGQFSGDKLKKYQLLLTNDISNITIKAQDKLRFLFVSGKPLHESVSWGGPIVMNTQEELRIAFKELDNGTFIKHKSSK